MKFIDRKETQIPTIIPAPCTQEILAILKKQLDILELLSNGTILHIAPPKDEK